MKALLTSALLALACLMPCWSLEVPYDGIASLTADTTLNRCTDLAVQVHSIDPPHPWILRSIELVAQKVAPAFGWRPKTTQPLPAEPETVA